jgi:hypothetical protein
VDLGCLLPVEVNIGLGTYLGWNLRSEEAGVPDELVSLVGSYIPFATTIAEQQAARDSRRSVEERYESMDFYVALLQTACRELLAERWLLEADAERLVDLHSERARAVFEALARRRSPQSPD